MADLTLVDTGYRVSETGSSTPSFDYTCSAGSNRKLIAFVNKDDSDTISSITYNSVAFTPIGATGSGSLVTYAYFLDEEDFPVTPGSYTVQATATGTLDGSISVFEFSNAKQGAVLYDTATSSSDYVIATVNVYSPSAYVVGSAANETVVTITQLQGTLVHADSNYGGSHSYAFGHRTVTGAGLSGLRYDASASGYSFCLAIVAVEPSDGGSKGFFFGAGF